MNKFNSLGMEAISYKEEYLKDYPELVHNSIGLAIDNKNDFSLDIKNQLKNKEISIELFKEFLKTETRCLKTYEELLADYEVLREKLNKVLSENSSISGIQTFSEVENECIQIVKEYIITEDFIKEYFDITDEKEFEKLMSRKGFIEKFAILRLTKIFKDFLKTVDIDIDVHQTSVFFSSEKNVYGILLEFLIPIDSINENEDFVEMGEKITSICANADINFNNRMLI